MYAAKSFCIMDESLPISSLTPWDSLPVPPSRQGAPRLQRRASSCQAQGLLIGFKSWAGPGQRPHFQQLPTVVSLTGVGPGQSGLPPGLVGILASGPANKPPRSTEAEAEVTALGSVNASPQAPSQSQRQKCTAAVLTLLEFWRWPCFVASFLPE